MLRPSAKFFTLAALAVAVFFVTGCGKPAAPPAETAQPNQQAVFGEGFYKEEVTGKGLIRWVRQKASLTLNAPSDGKFEVTFRTVTVFSPTENTIEVSVNGQSAGTVSTHTFDFASPQATKLSIPLHQGGNAITLRSDSTEKKLSPDDDRTPAFGLVLPLTVEKAP